MEIDIALGRPQGFASLSSEARIKLNAAKAERFEVKRKAALAKVKAATTAAKPAFKALEKAKKAGRVPAAVKAAAAKAQAVIDAWQEKADHAAKRISDIEARNAFHRKNLDAKTKPSKKVTPAKKPEKEVKPKKARPTVEKSSRRPEKRVVARPGAVVKPAEKPEKVKPDKVTPVKKVEPPPASEPQFKNSHPEDVRFATPYLNPSLFNKARTSRSAKRVYMQQLWNKLNLSAFHGKLRIPSLDLMPKVGINKRTRSHGYFKPSNDMSKLLIKLSPRLFLGEEPMLISAMAHEMAHQYVWVVDFARGPRWAAEGGHGPEWQAAMRMIGLTPARFSQYDTANFLTEDERKKVETNRANNALIKKTHTPLSRHAMTVGTRVAIVETRTPDKRYLAIIIGVKGKKLYLYGYSPHSAHKDVFTAPYTIAYVPTPDENRQMDDAWREEALARGRILARQMVAKKAMSKESVPFDANELHRRLKGWAGL